MIIEDCISINTHLATSSDLRLSMRCRRKLTDILLLKRSAIKIDLNNYLFQCIVLTLSCAVADESATE